MGQTTFSGPVVSQNGFIENSFTTAERDAIPNPTEGLLIYNTTTNEYEVYNGSTWQAAFGGGPAPVAYPKTFTLYSEGFGYDTPITFNAAGTRIYRAGGTNVYEAPLSTPWDISTLDVGSQVTYPLIGFEPSLTNLSQGVAWNGTGTQLSVINAGMSSSSVVVNVSSPYDLSTITSVQVGTTLAVSANSSISFGNNGNVAYTVGGGLIKVFNLSSPYDWRTTPSSPAASYDLTTNLSLFNYPQQVALSADGTIGVTFQSGPSYTGQITQFQLDTPWDITTINAGTAVTTSLSPTVGITYVGFGGCAIKPDFSKLYVSAGMMTQMLYEFNVS